MPLSNSIELVRDLMIGVGKQLIEWRQTAIDIEIRYKREGKEVVSDLDERAEAMIRTGVAKIFPQHRIWGEELGRDRGDLTQENFIIIDPIDGSKNYLSGSPLFASQIACMEKGVLEWAIIVLPGLNACISAVKGQGATWNNQPMQPSRQTELNRSIQCIGLGHDQESIHRHLRRLGNSLYELRHYGSAGVHFAFVAAGITDIYIAEEAAFYDIAPGLLVCQEVNGLALADLEGMPYQINEGATGIIIANQSLLEQYRTGLKSER